MSWYGETNPHFWSSNQPHTPSPPIGPSGPIQQPGQESQETIQPAGRRTRPRERPDHVHQPPTAPEPNPHFWPRDRRQATVHDVDPSGPARHPGQQASREIQPNKRRPKERHDHVQPPLVDEPNPHFWPRDRHEASVPAIDPSGHAHYPSQQASSEIQPDKRRPKERCDHVQPPLVVEPNPHLWPRDRRQASVPASDPSGLAHYPGQQASSEIQPEKRRPKEQHDHVQQPLAFEPNPHFWPRDRRQAPVPATDLSGTARHPGQQPPSEFQPEKRIRPKERPDHQSPPAQELNPHFWPRDQTVQPPMPSIDTHGPTHHPIQQYPGDTIQPEKRMRPKERHDHVHLPPTQAPMPPTDPRGPARQPHQQGPSSQTQEPELELMTTWPTHQEDPSPLHPIQASQEQRPLHPGQASHEGSGPPRPHSKKQQPRIGPTKTRPPHKHDPHEQPSREQNLIYPPPSRTNPCTWFIAIFCVILWVIVILGGILILIFYLFYRPRNPHFEISNASLNAAYLDMGYLLNADLVMLVNFTNPNEKMNVDFNFIVLKLLYENQPIANQYIESFSVRKLESQLATLEMVSSQIRLPVLITQKLVKQIRNNRITFQVDAYLHARSRLGSVFRYSYWIYSHCTVITTGPPSGTMVASKCITKR